MIARAGALAVYLMGTERGISVRGAGWWGALAAGYAGMNPLLWSQAVVCEVYSLAILLQAIVWFYVLKYLDARRNGRMKEARMAVIGIGLMLGLIMAFLGALQLRQYGANIYIADGVALAMVRELGPVMTAVLVAGRSGSGFAAELGSMAVDDQVDALVTMGLDPVSYLAVPRVVAVVLAMPCLAMLSSLTGIAGGLVVGVLQLDLTIPQYLAETRDILSMRHLTIGLVKSVFFGLLVSAVGCHRGLGVRGGAEQVGRAATASVVAGIFLIVLADALFAVVLASLPF